MREHRMYCQMQIPTYPHKIGPIHRNQELHVSPHLGRESRTKANYNVGSDDTAGMDIDQTEDKRGKSESAESERCRIGKLAEQALVRFGIEIGSRGRENGALIGLIVGAGVCGLTSVFAVAAFEIRIAFLSSSRESHGQLSLFVNFGAARD